jgi:hypothetical protein
MARNPSITKGQCLREGKTSNTLEKYVTKARRKSTDTDIYNKCGIYKLYSGSCVGVYVGQTGRSFIIRYKEHLNIKCNRDKTGYSQRSIMLANKAIGRVHDFT